MTTGATRFTRFAGRAGVLATLLSALMFAEVFARDSNPIAARDRSEAFMIATIVCGVVFVLGLIARHRGLWWVPVVAWILTGSVVFSLLSFMTGTRGLVTFAFWVGGLSLSGAMLGVFLAGELPRVPLFLMLITEGFDRDTPVPVAIASLVAGLVGFTWLAMVMAREPLAGSEPRDEILHGSPVPA